MTPPSYDANTCKIYYTILIIAPNNASSPNVTEVYLALTQSPLAFMCLRRVSTRFHIYIVPLSTVLCRIARPRIQTLAGRRSLNSSSSTSFFIVSCLITSLKSSNTPIPFTSLFAYVLFNSNSSGIQVSIGDSLC